MPRAVEFDETQAIQQAMHVFWQKGYAATSMRDLTEAMQINSSSLYNTLGDKQQLFLKALRHYTQLRRQAFQQYTTTTDSPFRTLERFINDAVQTITTEANSCLCVRTAFEKEGGDAEVQAIIAAYDEFTRQFLHGLIAEAQQQQEIASDESVATIADYLTSTFAGWYNTYLLRRDQQQIQHLAAYLLRQLHHRG